MTILLKDKKQPNINFNFKIEFIKKIKNDNNCMYLYYDDDELNHNLEDIIFTMAEEIGILVPDLDNLKIIVVYDKSLKKYNLILNIYPLPLENIKYHKNILSKETIQNIESFYKNKFNISDNIKILDLKCDKSEITMLENFKY